jgi:hypothetical protein
MLFFYPCYNLEQLMLQEVTWNYALIDLYDTECPIYRIVRESSYQKNSEM